MNKRQGKINYASQAREWHLMNRIVESNYKIVAIEAIKDVLIESHLTPKQRGTLLEAMGSLGATGSDYITICRRLVNGT
jgi:hypothetical protein